MGNGGNGLVGDRGTSLHERGTSTAPYRIGESARPANARTRTPDDDAREVEEAIQDDARLYDAYIRLKKNGWRLSRLALPDAYRVNSTLKTITLNSEFRGLAHLSKAAESAVRRAYWGEGDLRRIGIHARVLALLSQRMVTGSALTDLEIMAQTYEWAAWFFCFSAKDAPGFQLALAPYLMVDLTLVLAGEKSLGRKRDMQNVGFSSDTTYFIGNPFESTGFKEVYRDTSNQVRHATASIHLNLVHGFFWGNQAAQSRERVGVDFADIRLNEVCTEIAKQLDFLLSSADATALGALIRSELGDPSQTKPWPAHLAHGLPDPDPPIPDMIWGWR